MYVNQQGNIIKSKVYTCVYDRDAWHRVRNIQFSRVSLLTITHVEHSFYFLQLVPANSCQNTAEVVWEINSGLQLLVSLVENNNTAVLRLKSHVIKRSINKEAGKITYQLAKLSVF